MLTKANMYTQDIMLCPLPHFGTDHHNTFNAFNACIAERGIVFTCTYLSQEYTTLSARVMSCRSVLNTGSWPPSGPYTSHTVTQVKSSTEKQTIRVVYMQCQEQSSHTEYIAWSENRIAIEKRMY